jgi:hypothetical protein
MLVDMLGNMFVAMLVDMLVAMSRWGWWRWGWWGWDTDIGLGDCEVGFLPHGAGGRAHLKGPQS